MKILITVLLLISCLFTKAQSNVLNESSSQIVDELNRIHGYSNGVRYTKDGIKYLFYSFPMDNNSFLDAAFYLDDNDKCTVCVYNYFDMKQIERVVNTIKANYNFYKIENKFAWKNIDNTIEIKVLINEESKGFDVVYNKLK